jgi:hypothetical protein
MKPRPTPGWLAGHAWLAGGFKDGVGIQDCMESMPLTRHKQVVVARSTVTTNTLSYPAITLFITTTTINTNTTIATSHIGIVLTPPSSHSFTLLPAPPSPSPLSNR